MPEYLFGFRGLSFLDLSHNRFSGLNFNTFGSCKSLTYLKLSNNFFIHNIPPEIGNCSNLNSFLVGGNILEGGIPDEIGLISELEVLDVYRNSLTNLIPKQLSNRSKLSVLILTYTVSGLVSVDDGSLLSKGEYDAFAGGAPASLLLLPSFKNYLNGEISESLGHWKSLIYLYLSSNSFLGPLPRQLQVPCMMYFNVSRNLLAGFLPNVAEYSCSSSLVGDVALDDEGGIAGNFSKTTPKPYYRLLLNENMLNGSLHGTLFWDCNQLREFSVNSQQLLFNCSELLDFDATQNQIGGFLAPGIGTLAMLRLLDLRGNWLSGSLPAQLGVLKSLKSILLGANNLTGEIPTQLGELTSLEVLELSQNALMGIIPACWADASNLETAFLGETTILKSITTSRWNPTLFRRSNGGSGKKLKTSTIALVTSYHCILNSPGDVLVLARRKISRLSSLRRKVVVTFADFPSELNYDNVVRATENFKPNWYRRVWFNLHKGKLVPGVLIAVKRLSIGRFRGIQQFDEEMTTLGRIRHRNLVTLIGYYVGEDVPNLQLSFWWNFETFIQDRSDKNSECWTILKIAFDVAQALSYLHYSCVPRIVHGDITLNAYLSNFGLARLLEVSETHATTDVAGTFGYLAPKNATTKNATTCRVSDKADTIVEMEGRSALHNCWALRKLNALVSRSCGSLAQALNKRSMAPFEASTTIWATTKISLRPKHWLVNRLLGPRMQV
ncbi:LOW QUALITY PROTEIN: Protein kinase domain [Dillenia turbinata]|uniref:Protein kinase domain n=1 Tax=Dillenia turbinata TaxID=194707 RepID=A0AAN8YTY9_9MAGN